MDNDNVLTASDLVINAVEENPVSFKDTFDQLLMQKIDGYIEAAKVDVAQNYFNTVDQEADDDLADEQQEE